MLSPIEIECPTTGLDRIQRKHKTFTTQYSSNDTVEATSMIDFMQFDSKVLSALVGWSKIVKCSDSDGSGCKGTSECTGNDGVNGCEYLKDVEPNDCKDCHCKIVAGKGSHHLGRGCTKCKDSNGNVHECHCKDDACTGQECKCAKEGKCCKCCCKSDKCTTGCKKDAKCSCVKEDKNKNDFGIYEHKETYQSAYWSYTNAKHFEKYGMTSTWQSLMVRGTAIYSMHNPGTPSERRQHCARIFLGSVCLIWSGITYMYWTGKYAKGSPRWNNHILDGSGLDDGTLSQWLQALGFPREMLNKAVPGNRMDNVITETFTQKLFMGFNLPNGIGAKDEDGNTTRKPVNMHFSGFVHAINRDGYNDQANVFPKNSSSSNTQVTETNQHKIGALFKLYILSCAYFTGLQNKAPPKAENKTPKTIREILYWLSALPYSQAYPEILKHGKDRLEKVLKKPGDTASTNEQKQLSFYQTGRSAPITVDDYNLFAHFQAVTQYFPLVLIGIQGGLHSTTKGSDKSSEPAIHSLYANTECHFTYPTVSIQAYNQVVHYIRALFYQLYFLRKQCAVKVALGGKWRECRYGNGVVSKGVISWMCLGCDPMEHDRKCRVEKVKDEILKGVIKGTDPVVKNLTTLLEKIGEVVVQLGNAQEALEGKKTEAIEGVKGKLGKAKEGLDTAVNGLNGKLKEAKTALDNLTGNNGGSNGKLKDVETKLGSAAR